jgi:hypothetical protein
MIKKLILKLLIVQCLFTLPAIGQQNQFQPADINIEGLRGKVKRIDDETATLVMKNGIDSEVNRRRTRTAIFDKQGRLTYEWIKISNLPPFEHSYYYDKKGNRHRETIRIIEYGTEPNKFSTKQMSLSVFRFDSSKNILFQDEYRGAEINADYLRQKYQYTFDKSGRIIEQLVFDAKGKEVFKDVYIYGTEQLPAEKHLSMAENPVGQIFKYKYILDPQGNWTKQIAENTILKKADESKTEVTYRKISYYK